MALTKLLSNSVIGLAIEEVTAGTYLNPTTADIKLFDVGSIAIDQAPVRIGNLASGTFTKGKHLSGTKTATTSFKTALQSSGTPTVAPALKKLFEASGLVEYTDTNIGYKWDGTPTCQTISYKTIKYDCGTAPEGFVQAMRGAVGTLTISADAVGAPVVCTFNLAGAGVPESDLASASPVVPSGFDTADCEKLIGVTTVIRGNVHKVQKFSVTFGVEMDMLLDAASAEGIVQAAITNGDPVLTISTVNTGITPEDWYGDQADDAVLASTTMSFKNWDFTFGNLQVMSNATSDGNGFDIRDLELPFETFTMIQK